MLRKKTSAIPDEQATARAQAAEQKQTSAILAALRAIHSAASPDSMEPEDLERQRKGQELLGRLITPMLGLSWEPFELACGIPAAWVRPKRGHTPHQVILYCHGGGYTSGNLGYSRILATKLANTVGCDVLAFEYRLAPEHPYPAPLEDALAVWDDLMYLGIGARDVILVGDSAGGNLALTLTMALRDTGRRLPGRLVLLSPWTDLTASGASYETCRELDPVLTQDYIYAVRQAYAPDRNWRDPMLSPLFGDFRQFPPTLIQVGEYEILYSDSERLRDEMVRQGIPCCLQCWPELWHVFQMVPMKKATEAMEQIGAFLWQTGW
ncbi:MAG: alpha/beta hydrolase [Clostridiales bacterium]|nr:alpha/beta hydrolase [Clostridiales bacterium]